ncbi:MAG: CapA family protein, partial [Spirochaetaceae bacterium]|nr:CapA family protein [Spirochaetaceae bacterium]
RPRASLRWRATGLAESGAASTGAGGAGSAEGPAAARAAEVVLGRRPLALAAPFDHPRYSLSLAEAREARPPLRPLPLEDIGLPERAVAVEGRWPGEPGYPFEEELVLCLEAAPRAIEAWARGLGRAVRKAGAPAPRPDAGLTIGAVGDIAVSDTDAALLAAGKGGLGRLLGPVLPLLAGPDILAGNLEGVVSGLGEPNPRKRFRFRFDPAAPRVLAEAGFDLLLFANNHGFDFGPEGFADSLANLEASGLPFVGAGRDLQAAAAPLRLPSRPGFAFVGFALYPDERYGFTAAEAAAGPGRPGVASDEAAAIASIREAAAKGDFVVVLAHGGSEYRFEPDEALRRRYRRFVDAGARLVLGSHPHVLQGAEAYSGALIAYSLGNFLFTADEEPPEAQKSALLEVFVAGGAVRGFKLEPVLSLGSGTLPDPERRAAEERFSALCRELAERD